VAGAATAAALFGAALRGAAVMKVHPAGRVPLLKEAEKAVSAGRQPTPNCHGRLSGLICAAPKCRLVIQPAERAAAACANPLLPNASRRPENYTSPIETMLGGTIYYREPSWRSKPRRLPAHS
jgi:hypothetical protein